MSRQPDVSVGGHSFRLFLLFLAAMCAVTVASGARRTPTGVVLRRNALQILKESETDFAPGTSGGSPTYWLYRDFHREVPAMEVAVQPVRRAATARAGREVSLALLEYLKRQPAQDDAGGWNTSAGRDCDRTYRREEQSE